MRIILTSHGDFAAGLLNSYEMIAGKNENINYVNLTNDGISDFTRKLEEKLQSVGTDKVLILCDIKGGTPFNESYKHLLMRPDDIRIICGMNLPMLIEMGMTLDSSEDLEKLYMIGLTAGQNALQGINAKNELYEEEIDF
ncbi:PTS sugar transporter subunit IIA [Oceanobacillus jeddahense]|uniref:PTS sugar transporter subunit IIA n=1 Tax=Oceanobacillus jeddahense TaxID=1462527 RepID=A0ABY5JV88_9BACI|nr:PTS sugar transporter subunit IIA [Oceanobacillus jeddahense]UUI02499.1 PTS sugar transporter subunit IIA [Oceanobacillus jeddahense]